MQDDVDPGLLEHREGLLVGVAGVDHERLAGVVGELDLGREHPPLDVAGGVVTVEVESALAQRTTRG